MKSLVITLITRNTDWNPRGSREREITGLSYKGKPEEWGPKDMEYSDSSKIHR